MEAVAGARPLSRVPLAVAVVLSASCGAVPPGAVPRPEAAPELSVRWRAVVEMPATAFVADPPTVFTIEDGAVVRRDARTGRVAWRQKPVDSVDWFGIAASARFVALTAVRAGRPERRRQHNDGQTWLVVMLAADDGRVLWLRAEDREVKLRLDDEIVALVQDERALALDAGTGAALTPWLRGSAIIEEPAGEEGLGGVFYEPATILGVRNGVLLTRHLESGDPILSGWRRSPPAPEAPLWRRADAQTESEEAIRARDLALLDDVTSEGLIVTNQRMAFFEKDGTVRWSYDHVVEHIELTDRVLFRQSAHVSRRSSYIFIDLPTGRPLAVTTAFQFLGEVAGPPHLLVFFAFDPQEVFAVAEP